MISCYYDCETRYHKVSKRKLAKKHDHGAYAVRMRYNQVQNRPAGDIWTPHNGTTQARQTTTHPSKTT